MRHEEQEETQKNAVWRLYKQGRLIACLQCKVSNMVQDAKTVVDAWERDDLTASGGHVITRANRTQITNLPDNSEFLDTLMELDKAEAEKERFGEFSQEHGSRVTAPPLIAHHVKGGGCSAFLSSVLGGRRMA